jgi:hypothetical protein
MGASLGALSRYIDKRDEIPADLLDEVAMGFVKAKKDKTEYGRPFAPLGANLILGWLKSKGLNAKKSHDSISVDFSDERK